MSSQQTEYYRADGVRITHDPYAPGMAEKYGKPGQTDDEGFNPYRDTVGPGIYGGRVKRDSLGMVVIGRQYQNHNRKPGPVYAGGGYTPVNEALRNPEALLKLLAKFPDLANDVSSGGATPLHMCGMGGAKHHAVKILVEHGADVEALDTYGFTPLHRMASNNLAEGARALLEAGADPASNGACGQTPMAVAESSSALDVIKVFREYSKGRRNVAVTRITVMNAGMKEVNGEYEVRSGELVPEKFVLVCEQNGWDPQQMWAKLSGAGFGSQSGESVVWFEAENKSYIYYNVEDGHWWIDGPDGLGVYKALAPPTSVPGYPRGSGGAFGWFAIDYRSNPVPALLIQRDAFSQRADL